MSIEPVDRMFGKLAKLLLVGVACLLSTPSFAGSMMQPDAKVAGGIDTIVEFYNAGLDHYFISADPAEIAFLDGGAFNGAWKRTGESFPAWDIVGPPADTVPVCRFFGTDQYRSNGTRIGANSHFYTADPAECAFVRTGYQSVANDGKSYPAWTFESFAFAVKLPVGGVCPAGTQSLYRTYNDGMRGDPGHRYSLRPSLLQAMVGWTYEGIVMCLPPGGTPTAVGTPVGAAAGAAIGPAGGSLSSPDGRLTLTIPAGALASATMINIQPITNFAFAGIGAAYRLTPDGQTFQMPVALTFKYADADLVGASAEVLGAAFQTAAGLWRWLGPSSVDNMAKTVSIGTTHFTDISMVPRFKLFPSSKTIKPGTSLGIYVKDCYESLDENSVPSFDCDHNVGPDAYGHPIDLWSVNGILGGNTTIGTLAAVAGTSSTVNYHAPPNAPTPPTVAISVRVDLGTPGKTLLVSNITIALDSWTGTATGVNEFATTTAIVTWTLDSMANNIAVYKPSGVASATVKSIGGCSFAFDPPNHVIDTAATAPYNSEGFLTIDFNVTPPSYHGYAFTNWAATLNSPCGPPVPNIGGGPWFGGSGNPFGREASGSVGPDGVTIQGSASDTQVPPATFTWKFTRDQ